MPSVEETYAALQAWLPADLRPLAESLPWKLGLARSPDGGWSEFVGLHPNRALPVYAAEVDDGDGAICLPPERLRLFVAAHHLGGFYWLLRDRLRDGQIGAAAEREHLPELARAFGQRWREVLARATGDETLVDLLVRGATSRWRRGTELERRAAASGTVHPTQYAAYVRDKLAWIGAPSQGLILACGDAARLGAFLRAHDLFMLALQVIDDVIDRDEDRALRGRDVPTALHCSPGALLRVAPKLAGQAAAVAQAGGFSWFSSWLDAFGDAIVAWRLEGDALADELEAIGIAGEMEELVDPGRDPAAARRGRAEPSPQVERIALAPSANDTFHA